MDQGTKAKQNQAVNMKRHLANGMSREKKQCEERLFYQTSSPSATVVTAVTVAAPGFISRIIGLL